MIIEKTGYAYNDLTIIPSVTSNIVSRSECIPFVDDESQFLPIFASPMASVISDYNYQEFIDNGIIPVIPRNIDIEIRKELMNDQQWVALSLKEFEDLFINNYKDRANDFRTHYFIVVDIANGHMKSLYDKCLIAKRRALEAQYKLTIMTGNIANPDTYDWLCNFNYSTYEDLKGCVIDYIRVGIGGGCGCITTSNVAIHYPQATLIDECYKIKSKFKSPNNYCPKIIADGGIRDYDHVIKALALGADYVMIGSLFSQCIESAGEKYVGGQKISFDSYEFSTLFVDSKNCWWEKPKHLKEDYFIGEINVKFFGMASADGQRSINGKKTKTAEGITKYLPVKYTLKGWVNNMESYLRSAMSYCDCKMLNDFIGKPKLIPNSISEIQAVNK